MPDLASRRHFLRRLTSLAILGTSSAQAGVPGRKRLEVVRVELPAPGLPPALDGLRIAQLSDLHLEPFTKPEDIQRTVEACNALRPDLIALTGDFVTHSAKPAGLLAEMLGQLEAPHGVFACLGNHDFWSGAPEVERALTERRITLLRNGGRVVPVGKEALHLAGFDSAYVGRPAVARTLDGWNPRHALVMLMHEPDAADGIAAAGVQGVQLSGHTHGGQLVFAGRPPSYLRRARHGKKYLAGRYDVGGLQLYVNRGIGCVGLPLRIGCPPEITEITLRSPRLWPAA